jgi:hypothetical protein
MQDPDDYRQDPLIDSTHEKVKKKKKIKKETI